MFLFRESPPTLHESDSSSILLKDQDDMTDIAFPQLEHSKGMPSWISKHLTPSAKHQRSVDHNELLDEFDRPAWLDKKEKNLHDQV